MKSVNPQGHPNRCRKSLCYAFVWLMTIMLLSALIATPIDAQGAITVEPNQLTLAQRRGAVVERTLFIQTEAALENVRVIALDLNSKKGGAQIPGTAITIEYEDGTLAAGERRQVPVRFDLDQIPAGEYRGDLRITYADGSLAVPITIAVKDPPWLPLITLIAGVALGIGVSTYRARGRPRDIVMVRLGQIRTQMKADHDLQTLGSPFEARIESELTEAEIGLEAQQWTDAQQAIDRAYTLWSQWRKSRPDWIAQLRVYERLTDRLEEIGTDTVYISELHQKAEDSYRDIPDLADPEEFRSQLASLIDKAEAFLKIQGRIRILDTLSTAASAQAEVFRNTLGMLDPLASDFEPQRTALKSEIEQAITQARRTQLRRQVEQYRDVITHLPEETQPKIEDKLQTLREEIEALEPGDEADYVRTLNRVTGLMDEIPVPVTRRGTALEDSGTGELGFPPGVPKPGAKDLETDRMAITLPAVRVKSLEEQIGHAGRRLRWFTWITYGLAVALLALAGFVEIYEGQNTFGSAGVADYFTLLAWGFGSEATRSAVATMIQGWGIIQQ